MSYEINIVLGILYYTKNIHFTLCLHASDEMNGSDVDMLLKDFKNSILWFCMATFPETSTHMYPQLLYNISTYKSEKRV